MRKLAILLILILTSTLLPTSSAHATSAKIAVIYDVGGRGDGGSDDAAAKGVDAAKKKFGLTEFNLREFVTLGTEFDRQNRIEFAVKSGYQMIIAIGPNFKKSLLTIASKFPDSQYAIVDNGEIDIITTTNLAFSEDQGSYLAGALAALTSKSGKIAYIGENYNSQSEIDEYSFTAGAQSVNPKVQIFTKKINVTVGSEVSSLAKSGVDIVFSTWSKSGEVLASIVAENKAKVSMKYIGVSPEQFFLKSKSAAPYVIGYINKAYDKAIFDVISSAIKGETFSEIVNENIGSYGKNYNFKNGGTTFITFGVSTTINQKLSQIKAKLISGGIKNWKK